MSTETISLIIQSIGLVGVIGSLLFVGVEVRLNSSAVRAANNSSVADGFREVNLAIATHSELAGVFAANWSNPQESSLEDRIQLLALWRALFHVWSNAHRQHLNGTLDPAIYQAVVQEISAYTRQAPDGVPKEDIEGRQRNLAWAWESERFIFNPDFQLLMDGMLEIDRGAA